MFTPESQARANEILRCYGATHFQLSAEGELSAVAGQTSFVVSDGQNVQIDASDAENALAAIEKAKTLPAL